MYKVGESFDCGNCTNLITLKGAPSEVGVGFYCADCYKLSLNDDIPESIRGKIKDTLF